MHRNNVPGRRERLPGTSPGEATVRAHIAIRQLGDPNISLITVETEGFPFRQLPVRLPSGKMCEFRTEGAHMPP